MEVRSLAGYSLFLGTVCTMLAGSSGVIIGHSSAVTEFKQIAVSVGAAEYYLDEKHEKRFRWKGSTEPLPNK